MKGTMMRLSAALLALLLLCGSMAGCGKNNPSVLQLPDGTSAPSGGTEASPAPLSPLGDRTCRVGQETIPESTLFSFVLNEANYDPQTGLALKFTAANKSTVRDFVVSSNYLAVNGYMQDAECEVTVPAGQSETGEILIDADALRMAGVSSVDELILYPLIYDPAVPMGQGDVVDGAFRFYPTGQPQGKVVYPVRQRGAAEQTFFDNSFATMVILDGQVDGNEDLVLNCYLENKTERFLSFAWSDVAVNGQAVSASGDAVVAPGMRRYVAVTVPGAPEGANEASFKVSATPLSSTGDPVSPLMEQRGTYRFTASTGTGAATGTGTTTGGEPAGTGTSTGDEPEVTTQPGVTATPVATPTVYKTPTAAQKKNAKNGYVKKDDVNMRSGPGTKYKTVGKKVDKNTAVTLYELQDGWWFLKCGSHYGYIRSDFIAQGKAPKATATPKADSKSFEGTVSAQTKAALRKSADPDAKCLKELSHGAKVTVYYKTKGKDGKTWYYAASGKTKGYIRSDLVKVSGKVPSK